MITGPNKKRYRDVNSYIQDLIRIAWAEKNNIPIKKFPADWDKYGKSAGYRRNQQMAEYADAVILFPGGKGTNHMYDIAKRIKLIIYDFRETC